MMNSFVYLLTAACLVGAPPAVPVAAGGDPVITRCLLKPIDDIDVAAQEPGRLRAVEAREGMEVEANTAYAFVEDTKSKLEREVAFFEHQVAETEAKNDVNVRFAQASVMVADWSLRVAEDANARADRAVPKALVIQRKFELRKAQLSAEQAERDLRVAELTAQAKGAALAVADDQITRRRIVAPVSGIVLEIMKQGGEWVQAGDTVMRIVRLDTLRVLGSVDARLYNRAELASREVTVDVELAQQRKVQVKGKITFAHPEVDGDFHYAVWAEVPNVRENSEWLLQPGLPATMTIHVNPVAHAVPRPATTQVAEVP